VKICVVTRSYPAPGDLYKYPFVHRRVLAYRDAGHEVRVFQPDATRLQPQSHGFDGVNCLTGGRDALSQLVESWGPHVVAAHGFSETMWEVLEPAARKVPVRAWLHGSEIPAFMRVKALAEPEGRRAQALAQVQARCDFWNGFLDDLPPRLALVFVSKTSVDLAREDWGERIDAMPHHVVPNPVDTALFRYRPRIAEDRYRILLLRPFDSPTYANDLAVQAILRLLARADADRLSFTIIGDGPLFERTLAPLRDLASVSISRRFLRQEEIAVEHSNHGIFLVPTRLDTQGLSRDEAMASGLVPATNAIPAVCEFIDDSCAALALPDDADSLAAAVAAMIDDPTLFLHRSRAAAERIRQDRSNAQIIARELALLAEAAVA
jgi:glycosyltransferase involved in cell wall biosynthesis